MLSQALLYCIEEGQQAARKGARCCFQLDTFVLSTSTQDRKLDGDWQIRCREAFVVSMQARRGQHSSKWDNFALAFINLLKNYPETQRPTTSY